MAAATRSFDARFRETYEYAGSTGVRLEVEQEPARSLEHDTLDTGCTVWPAAHALADVVLGDERARALVQGARVLELGAGTGLAGIACAAAGAAHVCLTDLPPRIPLLRRNVTRNGWVRTTGACMGVSAAVLDWSAPTLDGEGAPGVGFRAELLVGADLVHDEAHCEPLVAAVSALLDAWPVQQARFLWAQEQHSALAVAKLRAGLEGLGFVFERLHSFPNGEVLLGARVAPAPLDADRHSTDLADLGVIQRD